MDAEQSFKLYIETLFKGSISSGAIEQSVLVDVEKLTGDASTRKYYRVLTDKGSWVVCLDDPQNKQEHNFREVQGVLSTNKVRVPRIYDHKSEKGYLLEEDLGEQTFLSALARCKTDSSVEQLYNQAIDNLIYMHSIDLSKYPKACFTALEFDQSKLDQEVELTLDFFIKRYLNYSLKQGEYQLLKSGYANLNSILSSMDRVFTHRDFHSRNMMVKDNELIIIDFQDARKGCMQYDLVSLLEDSYYKVPRRLKDTLIKRYWDNFAQKKSQQGFEQFRAGYDLMACQRVFKAIGSFCFIYFQRSDTRYLKYIGLSFERLKEIMKNVDSLNEQRELLCRIYYDS